MLMKVLPNVNWVWEDIDVMPNQESFWHGPIIASLGHTLTHKNALRLRSALSANRGRSGIIKFSKTLEFKIRHSFSADSLFLCFRTRGPAGGDHSKIFFLPR